MTERFERSKLLSGGRAVLPNLVLQGKSVQRKISADAQENIAGIQEACALLGFATMPANNNTHYRELATVRA